MLSSIINQQTLTTNVGGNLVCDSDACHPNPCVNGTCNVTSTGNYQCTCTPGYMGKNCDQDINECNDCKLIITSSSLSFDIIYSGLSKWRHL